MTASYSASSLVAVNSNFRALLPVFFPFPPGFGSLFLHLLLEFLPRSLQGPWKRISHKRMKNKAKNDKTKHGMEKLEVARKVQEEWEAKEERNRIAEENAANEELIKDFDDIKARIEADRLLAENTLQREKQGKREIHNRARRQSSFMIPNCCSIFFGSRLMVMFNPDDENEFWNAQQDWKIVSWKLHSSSGVHTLVTDTGLVIHMLVEKKYPVMKDVVDVAEKENQSCALKK
ncbi:hypothetical protein Tco_0858118, partial [Tanacetum coccineum]